MNTIKKIATYLMFVSFVLVLATLFFALVLSILTFIFWDRWFIDILFTSMVIRFITIFSLIGGFLIYIDTE